MSLPPEHMTPRSPTPEEKELLAQHLASLGDTVEFARDSVADAGVAVFDNYITDGPGYAGKLLSVVWSGGPDMVASFVFRDGKLLPA